jgi:hypothetical protein
VADTEKELPYYGKGATGWGIRTLVKWIEMRTAEGAGNTFTCAGAAPPAARKKRRGK